MQGTLVVSQDKQSLVKFEDSVKVGSFQYFVYCLLCSYNNNNNNDI